jgi:hypothetical protein
MSQLRLYSFINYYLSAIAQGIQTHHAAQEMMNKYVFKGHDFGTIIRDWSVFYKTDVLLNGGDNKNMKSIVEFLKTHPDLKLPWADFHEDEDSLGGILTAVAIIVPEEMYDVYNYRNAVNKDPDPTGFATKYPSREFADSWFYKTNSGWIDYAPSGTIGKFISILKSCPLAR